MKYGEKIKLLRNGRGMTQSELAEKMGVSLTTVQMWEWSQKMPRPNNMRRLAEFFDTTVGTLFFDASDNLK